MTTLDGRCAAKQVTFRSFSSEGAPVSARGTGKPSLDLISLMLDCADHVVVTYAYAGDYFREDSYAQNARRNVVQTLGRIYRVA